MAKKVKSDNDNHLMDLNAEHNEVQLTDVFVEMSGSNLTLMLLGQNP